MEILRLKNSMNKIKNAIDTNSIIDQTEDRTNDPEDRNFGVIQSKYNKMKKVKKNIKRLCDLWDYIKRPSIKIIADPREEKDKNTV